MKNVRCAVLGALLFVGCGPQTQTDNVALGGNTGSGGGNNTAADAGIPATDAGSPTDAGNPIDAGTQPQDAGTTVDAGTPTDGGTAGNCKQIASFASVKVEAGYDDVYQVAYSALEDSSSEPKNILYLEAYDLASFPQTTTFDATFNYQTCMTCVIYMENCAADSCEKFYLAHGGEATLTNVTLSTTAGTLEGSGRNLKLIEWDFSNDEAVPDGSCVEVGSASFNGTW